MPITPFKRVTSRVIYGADVSGLQDAVNKVETILGMGTASATNHTMQAVSDQSNPAQHFRIYEGTIRNWLESPVPVVRRGGVVVPSEEYVLYAAQGAIVFNLQQPFTATITADFTHITTTSTLQGSVTTHANLTNPHSATAAATADRIVLRDAAGRAKVAAPAAGDDIARQDTVTGHAALSTGTHGVGASTIESVAGAQSKVSTHNAVTAAHSATAAATASRIVLRDAAGRAKVAEPAAGDDIATLNTVLAHAGGGGGGGVGTDPSLWTRFIMHY